MKTITDYAPMVFGMMQSHAIERRKRRATLCQALRWTLPAFYVLASLIICVDTGLMPYEWRFWVMFAPIFACGEHLLWCLSRKA